MSRIQDRTQKNSHSNRNMQSNHSRDNHHHEHHHQSKQNAQYSRNPDYNEDTNRSLSSYISSPSSSISPSSNIVSGPSTNRSRNANINGNDSMINTSDPMYKLNREIDQAQQLNRLKTPWENIPIPKQTPSQSDYNSISSEVLGISPTSRIIQNEYNKGQQIDGVQQRISYSNQQQNIRQRDGTDRNEESNSIITRDTNNTRSGQSLQTQSYNSYQSSQFSEQDIEGNVCPKIVLFIIMISIILIGIYLYYIKMQERDQQLILDQQEDQNELNNSQYDLKEALNQLKLTVKETKLDQDNMTNKIDNYTNNVTTEVKQIHNQLHQLDNRVTRMDKGIHPDDEDEKEMNKDGRQLRKRRPILPNIASSAAGARVVGYSPIYDHTKKTLKSMFQNLLFGNQNVNRPSIILNDMFSIGECLPLHMNQKNNNYGHVTVQLAWPVSVHAITIAHIPESQTMDYTTAPKEFTVTCIPPRSSKDQKKPAGDKNRKQEAIQFGEDRQSILEYRRDGDSFQTFVASPRNETVSGGKELNNTCSLVRFNFISNYGNQMFTCLYHIEVHPDVE